MYDIQQVSVLKTTIEDRVKKERNNRNALNNISSSSFFQIDINSLHSDNYAIILRIDNNFKFNEHKHIVDIDRMVSEASSFDLCDELADEVNLLVQFFKESDYKTKKGDKLLFICPRTVGEYCPVCSFINSLKSIKNIPSIYNSNKFVNREDNDLIELTKFLNDIDKFVEVITNNIYVIDQFHMPCVLYDESSGEAKEHMLSMNKKHLVEINEQLSDAITAMDKCVSDVNDFTIRVLSDDMIKLESVNLSGYSDDFKNFVSEYIQKMTMLNKNVIESRLFSKKAENVSQIQSEFESMFNNVSENLCEQLNKISSMEGVL